MAFSSGIFFFLIVDFILILCFFIYSVSYMCRVGGETKKGFLLKQGKFIGRCEHHLIFHGAFVFKLPIL